MVKKNKNKNLIPKVFLKALGHILKNQKCWVVGGALRDVFWSKQIKDIDIVLEKGVKEMTESLRSELFFKGWKVCYFKEFKTSKIEKDNLSLGLSTLRREKYERDGSLPKCEFKGVALSEDLSRRDFTINAIAGSFNTEEKTVFNDSSNAFLKDLKKKNWKVFHEGSFAEDPTRLIRLYRYRFLNGGSLDPLTLDALKNKNISNAAKTVSPERWRNEIVKLLKEGISHFDLGFEEAKCLMSIFKGDWGSGIACSRPLGFYSSCRGPDAPFAWARLGARKNEIKSLLPLSSKYFPEFDKNWNLLKLDNLVSSWSDFLIDLVKSEISEKEKDLLEEYLSLRNSIDFPGGNDFKKIGIKGKKISHALSMSRKAIFKGVCSPDKRGILEWVKDNA